MTDPTGTPGDPGPDQAEPEEAESVERRRVRADELREILEAHETWVESPGTKGKQADLKRTDLQGANLSAANLQGANFIEANLQEADLQGADLIDANLQGASLFSANLQGAVLRNANLQGVVLRIANLRGADLRHANLKGASLFRANLQGAALQGADLQGASLIRANLQGAVLRNANLQEADLFDANLKGARLFGANLKGANLTRTNFEGQEATEDGEALEAADLTGANFRDADLSDARLSGVTGLLADKLAGANLSNAKLPDDIARFDGLNHVTEIFRHARTIFLAVIGGCVYSWLTIATTNDVGLLTNSATTPLPIIQTKLPIAGFYWTAPVILLGLYVYLHLYLQRLWQALAVLPAVFPDGNSLDQRAYPWLLTSLVNAHVPLLREKRPPFSRLQVFLSIIAAWVLVPFTLGLFWLRYLSRHDWLWTGEQVGILALAIALGITFYRRARATLRGGDPPDLRWMMAWKGVWTTKPIGQWKIAQSIAQWKVALKTTWKKWKFVLETTWKNGAVRLFTAVFIGAAAAGYGISDGAIKGIPYYRTPPEDTAFHRVLVPKVFKFFGTSPFLDLAEAEISIKPPVWTGSETGKDLEAQIAQVKKTPLRRRNLRYADARSAFLVKAELEGANLQGATLIGANLQGARLRRANLQGARLRGANLQGANFNFANLQKANLQFANLQFANLQGASFRGANLQGAYLRDASGLTQEQLNGACGDHKTRLPSPDLTIELCSGLRLGGVDLRTFKGLTQKQLDFSCGDAKTKLPPGLKIKPCEGESGAKN